MKRNAYDKVQKYISSNEGASVTKALKATKISAGTYYNQAKGVRGVKKTRRATAIRPTYDLEVFNANTGTPSEVRPGMVAIMGSPSDVAAMLAKLANTGR